MATIRRAAPPEKMLDDFSSSTPSVGYQNEFSVQLALEALLGTAAGHVPGDASVFEAPLGEEFDSTRKWDGRSTAASDGATSTEAIVKTSRVDESPHATRSSPRADDYIAARLKRVEAPSVPWPKGAGLEPTFRACRFEEIWI